MYWIQPAYLWLAAFLLPVILLLYFLKRKYKDQTISSTLLWEHALKKMEANRPWQKLQRHLLLWLQLLAAILLVLGLSRPAIPAGGLKAKHTILLIDVSGSMQAMEGKRSRLAKAKATARQLIEQLSPDQTMTLVEAGKTPRVLLSRTGDGTALKEAVDRLKGQVESGDLSSALTLAHALASKQTSSEIVLLGDGANLPPGLPLLPHRFLQMGATGQNVSIGSLTTFGGGNQSGVFARLDHHGTRDAQVLVTLRNDRGQILDTRTVTLPKKESKTVRWDQLPPSAFYHLKISSPGDALSRDNERWVVSERTEKTRVWLTGKENHFLKKALQLAKTIEVVHGDSLGAAGGDFPVKIINGEKGRIPEKGHLLLLDPASSQQLVSVTGITSVSGNVSGDPKHPLMQQVPLKEIHIADVKRVKVPAWAHVVLRSGDTPLILAGEQMGRRVVLFTFALEKSDLPLQPGFPVLMVQVMNWLAPASGASGSQAEAGDEIQLPLPPWVQQVKIQNPSSESETRRAAGGILRFTPEQTGLYQLTDARKKEWIHYVTVPFPQEESRIAPHKVPTAAFQGNETAVKGEQELWWWVALLSLAAVGLEWVVFSRGY